MHESWTHALNKYDYPVRLMEFSDASTYPGYFLKDIKGDRESTIAFEQHYREHANRIEAWYEVVYWKMFNQKNRREYVTNTVIQNYNNADPQITASDLLLTVKKFMKTETKEDFTQFVKKVFTANRIAVVATFPAFLDPATFPMVDSRVAKWVNMHYQRFNEAYPDGPQLVPSLYGNSGKKYTSLAMRDFPFYLQWIRWTRYMAQKLTKATGINWRTRDVEMAVFTAWGNKRCYHPVIKLEPI